MKTCEVRQVRPFALFLLLSIGCANAQFETEGVIKETDAFTDEVSCKQSVTFSDVSLTLANNGGSYQLNLERYELDSEAIAHNLYGALDGDEVLFLFDDMGDDEVVSYPLTDATADVTQDYDGNIVWDSKITINIDQVFAERLLNRYGDIEYRISANGEEYDGSLSSMLLNAFPPFRNECIE